MTAEEMLEAVRHGAERVERALGGQTERDLVRALVAALPACNCGAPATLDYSGVVGSDRLACDACQHEVEHDADYTDAICELPHAPALRALCARMRTWGEPAAPVAASDGGRG